MKRNLKAKDDKHEIWNSSYKPCKETEGWHNFNIAEGENT